MSAVHGLGPVPERVVCRIEVAEPEGEAALSVADRPRKSVDATAVADAVSRFWRPT